MSLQSNRSIALTLSVARVGNPKPDGPSTDDEGFHLCEEDGKEFRGRGQRRHLPQLRPLRQLSLPEVHPDNESMLTLGETFDNHQLCQLHLYLTTFSHCLTFRENIHINTPRVPQEQSP